MISLVFVLLRKEHIQDKIKTRQDRRGRKRLHEGKKRKYKNKGKMLLPPLARLTIKANTIQDKDKTR